MKGITSNTTIAIIIDCLSCPNLYIHGEKTSQKKKKKKRVLYEPPHEISRKFCLVFVRAA